MSKFSKHNTKAVSNDLEEVLDTSADIQVFNIARRIEIFLSGPIQSPEHYIKHYSIIRNAGPNDQIHIYINSSGGSVASAIQFIRAMQESAAHITCSAEGDCMSAATMIFLQGHTLEVTDNCLFLFHNYSGGSVGKGGEMYDNIVFEREWSKRLLEGIYKYFFTPEEIQSMLHNKDIWMHSEEVLLRCEIAMEARLKEEEEQQDAE